jgi:hypothetical protein
MKTVSVTIATLAVVAGCALATPTQHPVFSSNLTETDVPFVDADIYHSDLTADFSTDLSDEESDRHLQVVEGVVAAFSIASAVAPLITDLINSSKKECQQLACWIATSSRTCAIGAAEKVQAEITQGRDRYAYESMADNGMWVRYWRTKFEPVDRGDIATGTCTDGATFAVTNCQSTGSVHC